ncbi:MAG: imidazoleglycerol-phosphate dehydratase [Cyanobacteria bacterium P01_H01_bin.74]
MSSTDPKTTSAQPELPRQATVKRQTKETQIAISVGIDNSLDKTAALIALDTGLPFFDHMLNALACHGQLALSIQATGDTAVDPHHLIEDVGITLGEAIRKALPGYTGIFRAGCFAFPMDETLSVVALDLCGRPNLVWRVTFGPHLVGHLDPNLFREFFKGLSDGLRASVHIHVPCQDNDHHVIESVFKAFARALHQAVQETGGQSVLSTKGTLDV